jgi:hypothetical protein
MEFFSDQDQDKVDENWTTDIFPVEKTNLPAKSSKIFAQKFISIESYPRL